METTKKYWFVIEPYVYISITNKCALLYNTLDGITLESEKIEVVKLLRGILQKENSGVVLLTDDEYKQNDINSFIMELREKYMGDIVDVALSKGKPVQLLPFFNLSNSQELYKKHNFSSHKNVLENLTEITIYVDHTTNIVNLISFLQSLSVSLIFNIVLNPGNVVNYRELMSFFNLCASPKNILCSYINIMSLESYFESNFSYIISVNFPLDIQKWNHSRQILHHKYLSFEYVFNVSSIEDYKEVECLVEQFQIEKYRLNPIYTGNNIVFFEKMVFLTKEDILSTSMSIKDFFSNQSINIYDFGKINIMPNGDAYANTNHPALGNIYTNSIYEIVYKEVEEGVSWLRVRNQSPCSDCIYQWLCPPPSNHEIVIGRFNLCHIK